MTIKSDSIIKSKIYKRAIVDGYLKIFDLLGDQPVGTTKYKDFKYDELMTYYKICNVSMIVSFLLVISSMGLITYSIISDSIIFMSAALFFHIIIFAPVLYHTFYQKNQRSCSK